MSKLFAVLAIVGSVFVVAWSTPIEAAQRPDGARTFDFTNYEISAHRRRYYHRHGYRPYRYYRPYYYRPYYGYYRPWPYYGYYGRPAIGFGFYW
jgi:hypothetical protein